MDVKIKKALFLLIIAIVFVSCSKCQDCTCSESLVFEETWEVCKDDFDSNDDYHDYIDGIEHLAGCECTGGLFVGN